jgi:hypothetical protein
MVEITELLQPTPSPLWRLVRQIGVTKVVTPARRGRAAVAMAEGGGPARRPGTIRAAATR